MLQKLTGQQRGEIIQTLAQLLIDRTGWILQANERDLIKARTSGKNFQLNLYQKILLSI